jgi:hypothetical protein
VGRWKYLINTALFMLVLFCIAALNILITDDRTISESEKRTLAVAPSLEWETLKWESLTSGKFAEQFDLFINDRFLLRDTITKIGFRFEDIRGLSGNEKTELVTIKRGDLFAVAPGPPIDTYNPADTRTEKKQPAAAEIGELIKLEGDFVNQVLLVGDRGMEVPGFNKEFGKYYADSVAGFVSRIGSDVPVYVVLIPSQISFLHSDRYSDIGADQEAGIEYFYSLLSDRVTPVDAYTALENHKDEYIYFRTDHHWTALGAYYVYCGIIEAAGSEAVSLDQYTIEEVPDFLGSMYSVTQSERMAENPDTLEIYMPFVEHDYRVYLDDVGQEKPIIDMTYNWNPNKYQIFISSDRELAVIENEVESSQKILIVKDSYGNALIPFLMPHYREIHIIDPRYFNHNVIQYFEENGIDDILFINFFGVVAAAGGYVTNIDRVVQLPYDTEPSSPEKVTEE